MTRFRFLWLWYRRALSHRCLSCSAVVALGLGLVLLCYFDLFKNVWSLSFLSFFQPSKDKAVSDDELFQCTERWLQCSGVPANTVIPFVILPLTLEWEEFGRFMCHVNAHTHYLYIVQNGNVDEMTGLLRRLRAAVPSKQLIITQHPNNIGYAAAVNEGYRVALAKPHDEVPFVGVFNTDVDFGDGFFESYVPDVYAALSPDADRIRELEEEVTKEEQAAKVAGTKTLRATASSIPGLSLASLTPDRVRYAPAKKREREFSQHVGMFHFNYQCMCAFFVSRLALLTGGFLDENCYPAYFEDYDWQFRMANLGFRTFIGSAERYGNFSHHVGGNNRVIRQGTKGRSLSYVEEAKRLSRMLNAKPGVDYGESKWAWHREANLAMSLTPFPTVGFVIPPDAWILDQNRLAQIAQIGMGKQPAVEMHNTYNLTLLEALRLFDKTAK